MADLDELRDPENLRRAWRWIRSNPDASYKSYFRPLYQRFAIAEDALLDDLADRLRRGVYDPEPPCKIFHPKASGILRPYSLLTVEDQIVYQAAANLITGFVNYLDVFDDLLVDALVRADGTIGNYNLGQIGSVLQPTGRFAAKFPATFALVSEVHEKRYQSMASHPLVKRSGRPTKRIPYRFLAKAKRLLLSATNELIAAGFI